MMRSKIVLYHCLDLGSTTRFILIKILFIIMG